MIKRFNITFEDKYVNSFDWYCHYLKYAQTEESILKYKEIHKENFINSSFYYQNWAVARIKKSKLFHRTDIYNIKI